MTTRRTLLKGIPALALAPGVVRAADAGTHDEHGAPFPYAPENKVPQLFVGSALHGHQVRWAHDWDEVTGFRIWGIDRDWDGTWCLWADAREPTDDDMGGSISVHDPKIAAFLEEFVKLIADPDGYGDVTF